jgi:hypothetical protein
MGDRFTQLRTAATALERRLRAWPWKRVGERVQRAWRGRAVRWVLVVVVGIAGTGLGLQLGGQVTTPIGPADVDLSVRPTLQGETVVDVAPLGRLSFDTHTGPLRIEAGIAEIRLAAAQEAFQDPESIYRMAASVAADVEAGVTKLVIRALVAGGLGAVLLAMVVFRDWRRAAVGGLSGVLALAAAGGGIAWSFNPQSVAEPRYTGMLVGAPQAVGNAADAVYRFEEYREQLARLVGNVATLYEAASTLPLYEADDTTIRVLHVSDLRLNPAAWNVIESLSEQFQVDLVVDSGGLTEQGSAAEDVFADEISRLDVPYVWVRARPDSFGTQEAVEAQDNAVVLDDAAAEVEGLRIYGASDPRLTPGPEDGSRTEAQLRAAGLRQAEALADEDEPVDLVVVHDSEQAEAFDGQVPLVLSSGAFQRQVSTGEEGTLFIAQGSAGGAGLQGLQVEDENGEPTPYQASVLYFDAETAELQARDDITLGGLGSGSAQIERTVEQGQDTGLDGLENLDDLEDVEDPVTED